MSNFSTNLSESGVYVITLENPDKRNALSEAIFEQLTQILAQAQNNQAVRCVVFTSIGNDFSSGYDLEYLQSNSQYFHDNLYDSTVSLRDQVKRMQSWVSSAENFTKPIIGVLFGFCIGAAVDFASAFDIRFGTQDLKLQVKEPLLGIIPDIGTLQRLPFVVKNLSWAREIIYTGRIVHGQECFDNGFISRIFDNKEQALDAAIKLAEQIAANSPNAVQASKQNLVFSLDKSIEVGQDHAALLGSTLVLSQDFQIAIEAIRNKKIPVYPRL